MQVIIGIISVFGAAAIIILLSTLDMGGGVKAAIAAVVVVFIAVYCLVRIQSKELKSEKIPGNSVLQKSTNALLYR